MAKRRYLHTKHANVYRTLSVAEFPRSEDAIEAATRYALAISWVEGSAKREAAIRLDPTGRYWQVTVPVQVAR